MPRSIVAALALLLAKAQADAQLRGSAKHEHPATEAVRIEVVDPEPLTRESPHMKELRELGEEEKETALHDNISSAPLEEDDHEEENETELYDGFVTSAHWKAARGENASSDYSGLASQGGGEEQQLEENETGRAATRFVAYRGSSGYEPWRWHCAKHPLPPSACWDRMVNRKGGRSFESPGYFQRYGRRRRVFSRRRQGWSQP